MANLAKLLSSRGTPPPEICLDWAWQIETVLAEELDQPLSWEDLEVDASGALRLQPSETADSRRQSRAADLIQQLVLWSGNSAPSHSHPRTDAPDSPNAEVDVLQSQLKQQTLRVAKLNPSSPSGIGTTSHSKRTLATADEPAQTKFSQRAGSSGKPHVKPSTGHNRKLLRLVAAGGLGLAIIVTLIVSLMPRSPERPTLGAGPDPNSEFVKGQQSSNVAAQAASSTSTDNVLPVSEASLQIAVSQDEGDRAEIMDFAVSGYALPSLDSLEPPTDSGDEPAPAEAEHAPLDTGSQGSPDRVDRVEGLQGMVSADGVSADGVLADSVDVLAELGKVTRTAEAETAESELPEQDAGATVQPPLLLETSPMLQVNKISTAVAGRVRKPEWHIRIAAGEGFEVTPATSQIIAGREAAQWTIVDEEATEPATKIVIMAALLNQRTPSLRWRIVASAEDVPLVYVPLGSDLLDVVQGNLGRVSQQIHLGIEQLKLASKATGLPTELRSAISAQRRGLETQLKVCKRVLEVVADANQIDGWLDGQLNVHATLIDQANPSSTPVLQFGALDSPEGEVAESAPAL